MSSISKTERLLQSIRAQALALDRRPGASPRPKSGAAAPSPAHAQVSRHVLQRVHEIAADDPQRRSRAFRAFLEGNLVGLFGPDALADPRLQRLLDRVQETLQADPDMAAAATRVADRLLSGDPQLEDELGGLWRQPR